MFGGFEKSAFRQPIGKSSGRKIASRGLETFMAFTDIQINNAYDRTDGHCHICGIKLSFKNYGILGTRGAWHMEHSLPRSKGGTDHPNNLFAGCISCNLEKGNGSTRTARARYGNKRAPLSRKRKDEIRTANTLLGVIVGGILGGLVGGDEGAVIGLIAGGLIGNNIKPC